MSPPKIVRFYLPLGVARQARDAELPFYSKLTSVLKHAGFDAHFHSDELQERLKAKVRDGYSISLMDEPINARGLTIRRNYFYPFWNIQPLAQRWDWPVAKARFDPSSVTENEATVFANYWRQRLYQGAASQTSRDGFVYVPLQGRLRQQRSFQTCSPIEMLEKILRYDPSRKVTATLHPKEIYEPADLEALEALTKTNPRLKVKESEMVKLLQSCDYVATQNSAVAVFGYFFHKSAVLFGRTDFHHIAANVMVLGEREAIAAAPDLTPNFDAYLCWFFKHNSINVELPSAEDKMLQALRAANWPV